MTRSLRVAKNITTTMISQIVSWGLTFAVILFLPHYAGVTGLGQITLAYSFAGMFGLISSIGSSTVMMRDIPRDHSSTGRLILASLMVRIPLALLGTALGVIVGYLFGYGHQLLLYIAICLVGGVTGIVTDVVASAVRGLENFVYANVGSVIDKVLSSVMTVAVCLEHLPLWMIVATPIISGTCATIYMCRGLRRPDICWDIPNVSALKSLVLAGLPFLSAGIFVAIYAKSDAIFLSKLSTIQAIGWYGLAFRIGGTAMALPTMVCSAMLPPLSSLYRENKASFVDGTTRLINLMVISCIPIAATMIFCPRPLVQIFSHGTASFLPATNVVRIYGFAVMLWFISQAAFTGIVACDQQKIVAKSMGIAAAVSIPLTAGCVFIGQHVFNNGADGAAMSDLLIEVLLLSFYFSALPKGTVTSSIVGATAKGLVAVAPFIVLLSLLPSRYGLISVVPCSLIYGVLCWRLKCLHPKDIELFGRLIGGKFGITKA